MRQLQGAGGVVRAAHPNHVRPQVVDQQGRTVGLGDRGEVLQRLRGTWIGGIRVREMRDNKEADEIRGLDGGGSRTRGDSGEDRGKH